MMVKRFLASLAFILLSCGAGLTQTTAELQSFKAQALAKFASQELAAGRGLTAVRLALEAAQTPELSEAAHTAAFGALARAVSETDEFAALDSDSFGLQRAHGVFGAFLPGGRYYVAAASDSPTLSEREIVLAAASDSPTPERRGVVLLVDVQSGKVLDRRASDVGQVTQIAAGGIWANKILLKGATGALALLTLERDRFGESTPLSFGGDDAGNLRATVYLSTDGKLAFSVDDIGVIVSFDIANGTVMPAPESAVETGPLVVLGSGRARTETWISAALSDRITTFGLIPKPATQKLAGGRIVAGNSRRLFRQTIFDVASGKSAPVALPDSIGGYGADFALDPLTGRALVNVGGRGRGLAIVDLDDPDFIVPIEDAADDERPIALAAARGHWLTATDTRILTRDGATGKLIGWYLFDDGTGGHADIELGYAQNIVAITQNNSIRFFRLFFEEHPRSTDVSPDGGQIIAAHGARSQNFLTRSAPGGEMIETPIPDLEIARVIAAPDGAVAALDEKGGFHYWPDGLSGRRIDPDIPAVDMNGWNPFHIPFLFGPDFLAIGGRDGPCGLWSLKDWHQISGFAHAGCHVERFVFDAGHHRLAALGGNDGNVSVYETESGEFLAHFRKQEALTDTTDINISEAWFSEDGQSLHIVGELGWQVDLDIEAGAQTWGEPLPRNSWIALHRGAQVVATISYDDRGELMRLRGVDTPIRPPEQWRFDSATLSADGGRIAAFLDSIDGNAKRLALIDPSSGRIGLTYSLPLFGNSFVERQIRFSPDGAWVTAFGNPGHAWNFPTTEQGLIDLAQSRFGELTGTEACRWFMCE